MDEMDRVKAGTVGKATVIVKYYCFHQTEGHSGVGERNKGAWSSHRPPRSNTEVEILTGGVWLRSAVHWTGVKRLHWNRNRNPSKPLHRDCFVLLKEKVTNPFNLSVTLIGKVKMALVPTSDVCHGVTPRMHCLFTFSFVFLFTSHVKCIRRQHTRFIK